MGCRNTDVKTLKEIKESTDPFLFLAYFQNSFDHFFYSFKLAVFKKIASLYNTIDGQMLWWLSLKRWLYLVICWVLCSFIYTDISMYTITFSSSYSCSSPTSLPAPIRMDRQTSGICSLCSQSAPQRKRFINNTADVCRTNGKI